MKTLGPGNVPAINRSTYATLSLQQPPLLELFSFFQQEVAAEATGRSQLDSRSTAIVAVGAYYVGRGPFT